MSHFLHRRLVAGVLGLLLQVERRGGDVSWRGECQIQMYARIHCYSAVYAATAHIHVSYKCIRMSHTYAFSRPPRRCGAFSEFSVLRGNTPVLPCACWGVCRKVEDGQGRSGLDYAEAADHKAIIALLKMEARPALSHRQPGAT